MIILYDDKDKRLICDIISSWVIAGANTISQSKRHQITDSRELQMYIKSLLNIELSEEEINKVRSSKKSLLIPSSKSNKTHKYILKQF